MIRLIIAGSRAFTDYNRLAEAMDRLTANVTEPITVLSGTAKGADTLGERWAKAHGHAIERHPAHWEAFGKAAGPIRNKAMAAIATHCVVFWDTKSRGAKSMIDIAQEIGLKLRVINTNIPLDIELGEKQS